MTISMDPGAAALLDALHRAGYAACGGELQSRQAVCGK